MIVDSSAVMAIVNREPEKGRFVELLAGERRSRMSAANLVETSIVIDGYRDPVLARRLEAFMDSAGIDIADVTVEQAGVARAAYRDFGRGSGHPARLNFGDCFAYALAAVTGEPLLFKGDDFIHTDVTPAVR